MKKQLLALALVPFLSGCGILGLTFVEGPAPGWQDASAEDLPRMAIQQPCTDSKILPRLDAISAVSNAVFGIVGLFESNAFEDDTTIEGTGTWLDGITFSAQDDDDRALMYWSIAGLVWAPLAWYSSKRGHGKVNDCRAFNARLFEVQRQDAQDQAAYDWLDGFSPPTDLDVTAFDPVFGLPFNLEDGK